MNTLGTHVKSLIATIVATLPYLRAEGTAAPTSARDSISQIKAKYAQNHFRSDGDPLDFAARAWLEETLGNALESDEQSAAKEQADKEAAAAADAAKEQQAQAQREEDQRLIDQKAKEQALIDQNAQAQGGTASTASTASVVSPAAPAGPAAPLPVAAGAPVNTAPGPIGPVTQEGAK